jgi:EAL domain-containing protein (putative c-di-GMP-specific phosphodiesterase class I)/GGDEF domain-containing protein
MKSSVSLLAAIVAVACVAVTILWLRRRGHSGINAPRDELRRNRRVELTAWNQGWCDEGADHAESAVAPATAEQHLSASNDDTPLSGEMFQALRSGDAGPTGNTFVAVVEIDRFASLRQSIGYRLSNLLMGKLAERITASIAGVEIGRIGRTTIECAFVAESSGEAQLKLIGAIDALEQRMTFGEYAFDLSVAIGFADAGASSIRDELVDQAAAALTEAQKQRVKVCFADPDLLSQNSIADLELMRGLTDALKSGEVDLHYQPKLESRTNRIRGAEALVRWTRDGQLVPTARFVAVAEETGTIRELTEWVIARAVADQKRLTDIGHDLEISVNISAHVLTDGDFAETAIELVANAVGQICFEITETAVIDDPEAALANLRAFRTAGIGIAIDDYGSGLSSLAYLKQLPAHELKIDRMFISGLTDSHRDPLLVRSSIDLAHALEMEVTAEGVDDPMALQLLRVMGCDLLQGFYISVPLALDRLVTFLANESHIRRLAEAPQEAKLWERFATR